MRRKSKKLMPCPYYRGQAQKRIICKDRCFVQFLNEIEKNRFFRARCMRQQHRCNIHNAILERERQAGGKGYAD